MRSLRWIVALAAIAGCGSGTTTAMPSSVPPAPTPAPTPGGGNTVTVHVGPNGSMTFAPATVQLAVGDTVMWMWDSSPHTVTSGAPGAVDGKFCSLPDGTAVTAAACDSTSYAENAGATYAHTFDAAGTYPYFCEVHGAMMSGTVDVGGAGGGGGGGGSGGGTGGGGGY